MHVKEAIIKIMIRPMFIIAITNDIIQLVDDNMVNPIKELANESEAAIGAVNAMVNLAINIVDVNFDEDLLTKDECLQMMQQKHHIDMMLFGATIPLESKNQVEDNLSSSQRKRRETQIEKEIEAEAKKEAHKDKIEIEAEEKLEVQQGKALIIEQKEHNQYGSPKPFTLTIYFQCVGKQEL